MITARLVRDGKLASISVINNYGEVDTVGWDAGDFEWAGAVADRFGLLLVDIRDRLTAASVAHGFELNCDAVCREPLPQVHNHAH